MKNIVMNYVKPYSFLSNKPSIRQELGLTLINLALFLILSRAIETAFIKITELYYINDYGNGKLPLTKMLQITPRLNQDDKMFR